MKTNFIFTLLIAVLLVAAWSVLFRMQDTKDSIQYQYNSYVSVNSENYELLNKIAESNKSIPVFSGNAYENGNSQLSNFSIFSKSTSILGLNNIESTYPSRGTLSNKTSQRTTAGNGIARVSSTPFNATQSNSAFSSAADITAFNDLGNSGSVMMKTFFNGGEDDFEDGGGSDNEAHYNDVRLGDGLLLLLLLAAIFVYYKKNKLAATK